MLEVQARQKLGDFFLDAHLACDPCVTALFGHSGSGKTSLLRIIAGLSRPDHGRVTLDGETLLDTERGIFVPSHRRRFGYVFQDGRLFPHLTVRRNLEYGRWFAREKQVPSEVKRVIDILGIEALLDRRPGHLSGGERQRVAIGRALLSSPRLLLMDEPLAALDETRKAEILPYLERLRDENSIPIVYVSHSVAEVVRLADRVAMMTEGRIEAAGPPSDVLSGAAFLSAERQGAGVVLNGVVTATDAANGLATIRLSATDIVVPDVRAAEGQAARVYVPERDVMIATTRPEGLSALNILEGTVEAIEPEGESMVRIRVKSGSDTLLSRITAFSAARLGLVPGMPVFAVIKTVALER